MSNKTEAAYHGYLNIIKMSIILDPAKLLATIITAFRIFPAIACDRKALEMSPAADSNHC